MEILLTLFVRSSCIGLYYSLSSERQGLKVKGPYIKMFLLFHKCDSVYEVNYVALL